VSELGNAAVGAAESRVDFSNQSREQVLSERKILGVKFYTGEVKGAVELVSRGGLLVVPAAPALKGIVTNSKYRDALIQADIAIPDSSFMVLAWNLIQGDSINRISGLRYLRELLQRPDVRESGNTLWVMAREESARKNLVWLESQGIVVPQDCVYIAPMYGAEIEDTDLVDRLNRLQPKHIVITLGGGVQECLGLHLKRSLIYLPAIHCIGAAIAFLSGDQVRIPEWADRFYLGWLFRCVSSPQTYVRRYGAASCLLPLIWRYKSQLPV
jgi:exopolysaccharide biosynthesis WecB/TagA/CpsF family protein